MNDIDYTMVFSIASVCVGIIYITRDPSKYL